MRVTPFSLRKLRNGRLGLLAVALLALLMSAGAAGAQANPQQIVYRQIVDGRDLLGVDVPAAWDDVDAGRWVVDGRTLGVFVSAAPDLAAFAAGTGAGVFVGLTREGIPAQPAADNPAEAVFAQARTAVAQGKARFGVCTWGPQIERFSDAYRTGAFDVAVACERDRGRGRHFLVDLMPLSQNYRVAVQVATFGPADRAAVEHILHTIQVVNPRLIDAPAGE